ncbi:hypothetical protein BX666DRAFT_1961318 [Dichotomocladium elegans]|nr:hypothetical protein BX666DRAFT_1961318 [Dichotomocladium elegans]
MRTKSTSVPPNGISLSTQAKRRPRTTPAQRSFLKAAFEEDPYPSKERQRTLAAEVGFSVASLHFW